MSGNTFLHNDVFQTGGDQTEEELEILVFEELQDVKSFWKYFM